MTIETILAAQKRIIREQVGYISGDGTLFPTEKLALQYQLRDAIERLLYAKFEHRDMNLDDLTNFLTGPHTGELWDHINAYRSLIEEGPSQ